MRYTSFRKLFSFAIRRLIDQRIPEQDVIDLRKSALVFSPHFDDETLGCGGTVIRKARCGANVQIVFMTDGSSSHRHLMPEKQMARMRAEEGLRAALSLGVKAADTYFLNFKDGAVGCHFKAVENKVSEIITQCNPESIFIPHAKEPLQWSTDHCETTRAVKSALAKEGRSVVIYEYPIWYWYHWPWVQIRFSERHGLKSILRNTCSHVCGARSLMDFNYKVWTYDVLAQKRTALEQHKSQMTEVIPHKNWTTLKDISRGEFINCFFHDHELFYKYELNEDRARAAYTKQPAASDCRRLNLA